MAARKKAKSKTQRKKAPARKPAMRKKAVSAKKIVAAKKKPTVRRVAAKQKQVPRVAGKTAPSAPARKARPVSPPPRPAAPAATPLPLAGEERVGTVTHYFSQISVAIVRLESGSLCRGDTIHITGHTSDFRQRIESLQLEHQPVSEVGVGQEFGVKVTAHARENDIVYKMTAPQP